MAHSGKPLSPTLTAPICIRSFSGEEIEVLTRCKEIHEKSFVLQQLMVEKNVGEPSSRHARL